LYYTSWFGTAQVLTECDMSMATAADALAAANAATAAATTATARIDTMETQLDNIAQ
jgi:hypothetical protein